MRPSSYSFTEYSPEWPLAFQCEAERLAELFGDQLVTVHHIGSTAVPGLAAKPVIDMLPVVRNIEAVDGLSPALEAASYRAWGEYGLPGRRFFTKDREGTRTHNIHVYGEGHGDIVRHVAFCEYLKYHETTRTEYAELKREVYTQHPADISAYNDGKAAWIEALEPIALAWFRDDSTSP